MWQILACSIITREVVGRMLVRKTLRTIKCVTIMLNDNIRHEGALGNLTIIIFAPGSDFDRAITFGVEGCELSALDTDRRLANESAEMKVTLIALGHGCHLSNFFPSNVSSYD